MGLLDMLPGAPLRRVPHARTVPVNTPPDPQPSVQTWVDIVGRLASAADASATTANVLTEFLQGQVKENAQARSVLGQQAERLRGTQVPDTAALQAMAASLPASDAKEVQAALASPDPAKALRELRKKIESEGPSEAQLAELKDATKHAGKASGKAAQPEVSLSELLAEYVPERGELSVDARVIQLLEFVKGMVQWLETVASSVGQEPATGMGTLGQAIRHMGYIKTYTDALPPALARQTIDMPAMAESVLRLLGVDLPDDLDKRWGIAADLVSRPTVELERRATIHLTTALLMNAAPQLERSMKSVWTTDAERQAAAASFKEYLRIVVAAYRGQQKTTLESLAGTIGSFLQAAAGPKAPPDTWSDTARNMLLAPPKAPGKN